MRGRVWEGADGRDRGQCGRGERQNRKELKPVAVPPLSMIGAWVTTLSFLRFPSIDGNHSSLQ